MTDLKRIINRKFTIVFLNLIALSVLVVWIAHGQTGHQFMPQINVMAQTATKLISHSSTPSNASNGQLMPQRDRKSISHSSIPSNVSTGQACHFTNVAAFDPAIIKKVKKYTPVNCSDGLPWLVYRDGPFLKVNTTKVNVSKKAKTFSHCQYRTLTKSIKDDKSVSRGTWSKRFNTSIRVELRPGDDAFLEVVCYNTSKIDISYSYMSFFYLKQELHEGSHASRYVNHIKRYAPKETLNILLVGVDGLSKQNFERSMPKTRDFLLRNLSAIELQKYNKVGLNTFPNVLPLLTGHHSAFYKKVNNWSTKQPFDKIASYFVWSEFSKAGYRTAMDLEEKSITAFHYLKKGFYKSPVDYYTRPMVLAMEGNKKMLAGGTFCRGDKPTIDIHNDFLLEFPTRFNSSESPYFAFSFMTRLTHNDQNKASQGDHLYLSFLQRLKDLNALNNTVLIFFSDHGERFGSIRQTYNGIIESKSPAGFIVLPDWFKSKYPDEHKRFQTNAGRLTTVFDLHATLRDILYFKSASPPANLFPGPGISLFHDLIPELRTCKDASIPTEYCNCNSLSKVGISKELKKLISSSITDNMMKALGSLTKAKCHTLVPKSVHSILEQEPPKDRFKNIITSNSVRYYVTMATTPGHGVFEALVELMKKENKTRVLGSISRLDMYKGEKDCITDPKIRPFCFCK